ncbi:hypothetical protein OIU77_012591 [Salix suchowensis]|uniref:DC1 domain-containing protein n=1 Tax=Salix suchowensis TaxID=1278906 RepID=A0ABQ9A4D7_9ROSI|nr:hypothetical protein OIU77_012591 [Salix suchowensis]
MGLARIKHPSHGQHYLLLKLPHEPYWCNGCMGLGFGPCYECEHEACGFYLHEECANAAPSTSHPFSKCSLKFHYNAPQGDAKILRCLRRRCVRVRVPVQPQAPTRLPSSLFKAPPNLDSRRWLDITAQERVAVEMLKMWKEGKLRTESKAGAMFLPLIDTVTI